MNNLAIAAFAQLFRRQSAEAANPEPGTQGYRWSSLPTAAQQGSFLSMMQANASHGGDLRNMVFPTQWGGRTLDEKQAQADRHRRHFILQLTKPLSYSVDLDSILYKEWYKPLPTSEQITDFYFKDTQVRVGSAKAWFCRSRNLP